MSNSFGADHGLFKYFTCLFKRRRENAALFMEAESTSTERYLKVLAWLHANQKMLMIVAGAAAVIALIVGIFYWKQNEAESNANAQLLSVPLATLRGGRLAPAKPARSWLWPNSTRTPVRANTPHCWGLNRSLQKENIPKHTRNFPNSSANTRRAPCSHKPKWAWQLLWKGKEKFRRQRKSTRKSSRPIPPKTTLFLRSN